MKLTQVESKYTDVVVWIAFATLLRKEIRRFLRIWIQTILPSLVTTGLYFLIFGKMVGNHIQLESEVSYVNYIAPGLIMMAIITNAYSNVSSSFLSMRFQRSIEEILVAPMPDFFILLGLTLGGVIRALLIGCLLVIQSFFFADLPIPHPGTFLLIAILTAMIFALAGFANALFAKNFDAISIIPTFVLTPLIYLGGIFYSIDLLSPFWRSVSLLNPVVYILNVFRYALLGHSDIIIYNALLVVTLCCLFLFCINLWLLQLGKGIRS